MSTVMVDIRSCDSWWQGNGEPVYCTHEHASSFASNAIRAHVQPLRPYWETGLYSKIGIMFRFATNRIKPELSLGGARY